MDHKEVECPNSAVFEFIINPSKDTLRSVFNSQGVKLDAGVAGLLTDIIAGTFDL